MLEENENNNNKMKLNHPKKVRKPEAWNRIICLVCGKICTQKKTIYFCKTCFDSENNNKILKKM